MKKSFFILLVLLSAMGYHAFGIITPTMVDSVTMRDGKKLAVDIYIPDGGTGTAYPVILVQTPYNRQAYRVIGLPLAGNDVAGSHYAFVIADWRGFFGSMDANVMGYERGKDGYDLVEWIATQPWSNGRLGTWGPSALGKIQFQTAKTRPPHLVCCVPLVASPQFEYQEYYPGGVYRTEYVEQLDALGFGISTFIKPYPTYDNIWQFIFEPTGWYPDSIAVPMLMIGGWYDHGTVGILEMYNALRTNAAIPVRDDQFLLMGPWAHGGFGPVQVGSAQQGELFYYEADGWSDSLALSFLDHYLDQTDSTWNSAPFVKYFQMGSNEWMEATEWPVTDVAPYQLYFHPGGGLYAEMPFLTGDFGIITYDPADPSPTIGGATLRQDLEQGPYDQSLLVESRNDLLKFSSVALGQDVVMRGKSKVHLFVSSDRKDTDFAVRLTDVYPDGRSMLLAEGIRRLRFRDGFRPADTAVAVPGTLYEIEIELPDVANTFLAGHRIRVDVSSSNYPRYDCNLNNGLAMYTAGDTLIAITYVYINPANASYVELPLMNYFGGQPEHPQPLTEPVISPNPASTYFDINYPFPAGEKREVSLFSMNGACVYQQTIPQGADHLRVDISGWATGVYYLRDHEHISKIIITH